MTRLRHTATIRRHARSLKLSRGGDSISGEPERGDQRRVTGGRGERAAARYLRGRGWTLVALNARTRYGEIDLIGIDRSALVFVEVKTLHDRNRAGPGHALEAIGPAKRARIRRLARAWLADPERPRPRYEEIRFDAIALTVHGDGRRARLEHVEAAF